MKDKIELHYVVNGQKYEGEIDRENFLNWMGEIAKGFQGNNEISARLVKEIPTMILIKINQDANDTQDVPIIQYEDCNGNYKIMKIRRNHRIIWGFLQHYCDEVKK